MKAVIFGIAGTISLQVLSSIAADGNALTIRAFENRFGGPHQRQAADRSRNSAQTQGAVIQSQGGSASAATTTGNRRVQVLDASTMNIPVFPGRAPAPEIPTVTVFPQGIGFAPMTNIFGQIFGADERLVPLPPRTTGAGVATNAVPFPAAPRPTTPGLNDTLGAPPAIQGVAPAPAPGAPVVPPGTPGATPPARTPFSTGAPTDPTPAPAAPRPTR